MTENNNFENSTAPASLVKRLVMCGFNCEAGPLDLSEDFKELVRKTDLWVVTKKDQNICHTSGNGGWRFTVCTNKAEAEYLADKYNRENYGGNLICGVKHLLDT